MRRPSRNTGIVLCLLAATLWAADASARTERLRWQHGDPSSVNNFRIYWGDGTSSLSNTVDVGIPAFDSTADAFYYDLTVPDALVLYVAVTAWGDGLESSLSNVIVRDALGGDTGDGGSDPPPDSDASAAVVGFALWDASTDTRVDADFVDGETIASSLSSCAAIEILGNSYLQNGGAGSVKKVFDGQDLGCVSGDYTTYENSAPFVWENHSGSDFQCSPSLADPGAHTLTVTPYDGDNCSGAAGDPVSVTFSVELPTTADDEPLGAPGQPYLVQ